MKNRRIKTTFALVHKNRRFLILFIYSKGLTIFVLFGNNSVMAKAILDIKSLLSIKNVYSNELHMYSCKCFSIRSQKPCFDI